MNVPSINQSTFRHQLDDVNFSVYLILSTIVYFFAASDINSIYKYCRCTYEHTIPLIPRFRYIEKWNENESKRGDMGEKPIWEQLSAFGNSLNKIILLERATEDAAAAERVREDIEALHRYREREREMRDNGHIKIIIFSGSIHLFPFAHNRNRVWF